MYRPTFTQVLCVLFLGSMAQSLFGIVNLLIAPKCEPNTPCYSYYLNSKRDTSLTIFFSYVPHPSLSSSVDFVKRVPNFDYNVNHEIPVSLKLLNPRRYNDSIYLHVCLTTASFRGTEWMDFLMEDFAMYTTIKLTHHMIPVSDSYVLIGGRKTDELKSDVPVNHLKRIVGFNVLTGISSLPKADLPPEIINFFRISKGGHVLPIMHYNFLFDRLSHLHRLSPKNKTVDINLKYSPLTIGRFRLLINVEMAFASIEKYGFSDKELDQIKGIFADTNLYLLCVTVIVSSLHLLFDFLAVKNDVDFWRSRESMVGLSPRTVFWKAFSQTVIFLYLLDENTSLLILGPAGIALILELWKVQKVVPIDWKNFKLKKVKLSDAEVQTRMMDAEGMHYLSYFLYPLCLFGAVYSLLYEQYKSWYSWLIHSSVNGVYAFGFLFMLPQLFINYKMKSVSHLPWKAFMYKAFNTFIDDLFAFIIEMPTAHRIACFRDDIVFLVYLYQRWLYPVDSSRIEAGVAFGADGHDDKDKKND